MGTFDNWLKDFQNKKHGIKRAILITGCSGFIGNYLINTLLNKKFDNKLKIYGLDIVEPKLFENTNKKNFYFIYTNVCLLSPR